MPSQACFYQNFDTRQFLDGRTTTACLIPQTDSATESAGRRHTGYMII
jgi:hypothetical protein